MASKMAVTSRARGQGDKDEDVEEDEDEATRALNQSQAASAVSPRAVSAESICFSFSFLCAYLLFFVPKSKNHTGTVYPVLYRTSTRYYCIYRYTGADRIKVHKCNKVPVCRSALSLIFTVLVVF